jgi:hypothetical protein
MSQFSKSYNRHIHVKYIEQVTVPVKWVPLSQLHGALGLRMEGSCEYI